MTALTHLVDACKTDQDRAELGFLLANASVMLVQMIEGNISQETMDAYTARLIAYRDTLRYMSLKMGLPPYDIRSSVPN